MQGKVLTRKNKIKNENIEAGRGKKGRSFGLLCRVLIIALLVGYIVPAGVFFFPMRSVRSDAKGLQLKIDEPQLVAQAAILIDVNTGEVLYKKNETKKMFPASTTKMMTALVVCDKMDLDKVLVMPRNYNTHPARFGIRQGDTFTVRELLNIMLVKSANDAAAALAEATAGSIDEFSKMMNQKAKELNLVNSHFDNPHGLPDSQNWSCAQDLSTIAQAVLKNETLAQIVSQKGITVGPKASCAEPRQVESSNKFMTGQGQFYHQGKKINEQWELIDGVKTGFTYSAGYCLAASAQMEGQRLLSVVLKSDKANLYADSRRLLEYGFIRERLMPVPQLPRFIVDDRLEKCAPVPTRVEGIMFVPARDYFAALGYDVTWEQANRVLQAKSDAHTIRFKQGGGSIFMDGTAYPLGGYPRSIEGKLCIPVGRISALLGYSVEPDVATDGVRLIRAEKTSGK